MPHAAAYASLAENSAADERDGQPVRTLYDGLIQGDEQTVETAAMSLAAIREAQFEPPPARCLDLISRPAVAGLSLARRRGLAVEVDSDAIPPIVCQHDWTHRDHELSELAQKTLDDIGAHDLPA